MDWVNEVLYVSSTSTLDDVIENFVLLRQGSLLDETNRSRFWVR